MHVGRTASMTHQQGMRIPLRYLNPRLVCPEVRVFRVLDFVLFMGLMKLITVRYHHFLHNTFHMFIFSFAHLHYFHQNHAYMYGEGEAA